MNAPALCVSNMNVDILQPNLTEIVTNSRNIKQILHCCKLLSLRTLHSNIFFVAEWWFLIFASNSKWENWKGVHFHAY